jgi:hypothetical protein
MNQAEINHIVEKVEGGSKSNLRVISKKENIIKVANRKKGNNDKS